MTLATMGTGMRMSEVMACGMMSHRLAMNDVDKVVDGLRDVQ